MKTSKLMIKTILVVSLFVSGIIADDGHIGGGGIADDGHIGGGGYTCTEQELDENGNCPVNGGDGSTDTFFEFVAEYLTDLVG